MSISGVIWKLTFLFDISSDRLVLFVACEIEVYTVCAEHENSHWMDCVCIDPPDELLVLEAYCEMAEESQQS